MPMNKRKRLALIAIQARYAKKQRVETSGESETRTESVNVTPSSDVSTPRSISARKLSLRKQVSKSSKIRVDSKQVCHGYRLIDVKELQKALDVGCCRECGGDLQYVEKNLYGAASLGKVVCSSCGAETDFRSSTKVSGGSGYDINARLITALRAAGIGLSQVNLIFAMLDSPPLFCSNTYSNWLIKLRDATQAAAEDSMLRASNEIHKKAGVSENECVDCVVMCDGTWHKRGHSSLHGVVSAISMESGKVLDVECMSKKCKMCERYENVDKSSKKYEMWSARHAPVCRNNYSGSSPNMEPTGVLAIFNRSIQDRQLRYKTLVSDGDSKSYKTLCDLKPYGPETDIVKKECVGHVQKRMGNRLRKVKRCCGRKKLSDKKTIGGKGRLTEKCIDQIQTYYGLAIRRNVGDLDKMKQSVLAILDHMKSTDQKPCHSLCPPGPETWCRYNRTTDKSKYKHTNPLPEAVVQEIRPTFDALSDSKLLDKCLDGYTQNACESFNSNVWSRCPKEKNVGSVTVQVAVYDSVCNFNDGRMSLVHVLEKMGVTLGENGKNYLSGVDESRVLRSVKRESELEKKKRIAKRRRKLEYEESAIEREGCVYEPGGF